MERTLRCVRWGYEVNASSDDCIDAINSYYLQVLSYGRNRKVILKAPFYDKDCVLANILAAHYLSSSDPSRANSYVEAAVSNLEQSTPYEKAVYEAVTYLISENRDDDLAFEMHTELLKRFPKDLVSLKRAQLLSFYMGQPAPFLSLVLQVLPANQEESYIHGILAFPLLELGRMEEAAAASRKGYEINKEDAWAHHCLCHVFQHECRFKEAVEFMEPLAESWPSCSSFMYTHNWWHVALCYLEGGSPMSKVEEIYDHHIWKELEKDDAVPPEVYLNALGLLLRLDVRDALDGFEDRLKILAVRLTNQANWYLEWHLDILIIWALAKVGETTRAHELLEGLKLRLSKMNKKKQQVMQKGVQLGEAVYEFARGNYKKALELLGSEFNATGYKILSRLPVDLRYEVKCLTETQALKLFSFHSLGKENPTACLLDLSKKIVEKTGLLPLAVELVGSLLYDKRKEEEWQVQLEKLKNTQPGKLHDVLALSFESLDDEEKKVFLDIACLFLRMEITKEEVIDVLKGCGLNAEAALKVLIQKSLLKIMKDDTLWMHDQIKDMGRQIVLKESREDLGMRSRLWDRGEIMNVLNYMKGTTSIRGIVFDFKKKFVRDPTAYEIASMNLRNNPGINSVCNYLRNIFIRFGAEEKPKSSEITIRVEPFIPMKKLRLLQINHVNLEGNLKLLPSELKWIQWKGCPLETLPPDFLARQLGVLDLSESGVRRIKTFRKMVDENLKVLNLRGCHRLEEIPDLSNHQALEKLVFERCNLLVKVPTSVGKLGALIHLDFRNCSDLAEFLVDVSGLKLLENLFLSGCSNLSILPENIGALEKLKALLLDGTAIKNLPESFNRLQKLKKLSLKSCRSFQDLPLFIGTLTSLEKLYLDDTALRDLPLTIGDLKNLQKLHLMRCANLSKIPDTINKLISLKELFINGSAVEELPLNHGSLPCLNDLSAGDCKSLKQVPSSIGGLHDLHQLQLDNTPIETLPKEISHLHFIRKIELRNCKSLTVLPESIGDMDTLESLYIEGSNIEKLPDGFGKLENLVLLRMNKCKMLKSLPNSLGDLKSLHHLYMEETSVVELPESFGNLSKLMVLKMLKKPLFRSSESEEPLFVIPNSFSNLLSLEELDARSWGISGQIPDDLEKLSSLKKLNLGNNYFHSLPASLKGLSSLKKLSLYDCRELQCLPPLPCKLEKLNLANCFSLESISDLSELTVLQDINLTNCKKVNDVPGLENLKALKRLYMSGCNTKFSLKAQESLSKASLKMIRNLSLPANKVPDWFSQGPLQFSAQPNRELRGIILAVVVALDQNGDDYQLPDVVEVQAQILKLDLALYDHTLHLSGVPRTSNDQLHICRYSAFHPMVMRLKDGYTLQVIKRNPPYKQGVELKMHGIHLVYEGDDDLEGEEDGLPETQLTVSQKLAKFFSTLKEGENSSKVDSTVT